MVTSLDIAKMLYAKYGTYDVDFSKESAPKDAEVILTDGAPIYVVYKERFKYKWLIFYNVSGHCMDILNGLFNYLKRTDALRDESSIKALDDCSRLGINHLQLYQLSSIGKHKVYHQEGNAWIHTQMVAQEMSKLRPNDEFALKLAYLHDIGKIYTSIEHGKDDWEYPDHSTCGSFRGILCKFISEDDPDFKKLQWYIKNHIQPLFWEGNQPKLPKLMDGVSYELLRDLAICDIQGSISIVSQQDKVEYLKSLTF